MGLRVTPYVRTSLEIADGDTHHGKEPFRLFSPNTSVLRSRMCLNVGSPVQNCSSPTLSGRFSFELPVWRKDRSLIRKPVPCHHSFRARKRPRYSSYISSALSARCDILSTILLNAGLLLVVPSIKQIARGTAVLFSALFSVWFLSRRIEKYGCIYTISIAQVFAVAVIAPPELVGYKGVSENSCSRDRPYHLIECMGLVLGNVLSNEVVRPPTSRFLTAWSKEVEDEEREHLQIIAQAGVRN
ncbi:hypothetical protein BDR22DRAFT_961848 [Usnea florida]